MSSAPLRTKPAHDDGDAGARGRRLLFGRPPDGALSPREPPRSRFPVLVPVGEDIDGLADGRLGLGLAEGVAELAIGRGGRWPRARLI
jgi:hypothetical protein